MAGARENVAESEAHRLQLEDNLTQLQSTLQHWQTWDAEYESLKEEVEAAPDACTPQELRRIHDEFEGELLNGKEIDEVFGLQDQRPKAQIVNVLQRRIDYVSKNVESLHKQIEAAEIKLEATTVVAFPETVDEHGQPVTEIIEQLDDDDNVLSYELKRPGDAVQSVQAALKKVGVDETTEKGPAAVTSDSQKNAKQLPIRPLPAPSNLQSNKDEPPPPPPTVKKSVTFSEDVQEAPAAPVESQDMSIRARRLDEIMRTAREQEDLSKQQPFMPEDESPEDAELRRQMLQYGMGEVGAVVGELELEEVDSDDDSGIDYGDDDFDDDDDGEDRYGRSTGRIVTDEYKERMLQLEQRLGIKSRFTEGSSRQLAEDGGDDDDDDDDNDGEGIGRIVVKKSNGASSASKPAPRKSSIKEGISGGAPGKVGVRFANELDIAPDNAPPAAQPTLEKKAPVAEPLSDVVERISTSKRQQAAPPSRPSRFKKARDGAAVVPSGPLDAPAQFLGHDERAVPTGPEGSTIADMLVERDTSSSAIPPDEYDDAMVHQEIADEHQRMRRRFIQRDGGFLKEDDESPIQSLEDEGKERVSRFKAARLSRQ